MSRRYRSSQTPKKRCPSKAPASGPSGGEGTTQLTKFRSLLTPIEYTKQLGRSRLKIWGGLGCDAACLRAASISASDSRRTFDEDDDDDDDADEDDKDEDDDEDEDEGEDVEDRPGCTESRTMEAGTTL